LLDLNGTAEAVPYPKAFMRLVLVFDGIRMMGLECAARFCKLSFAKCNIPRPSCRWHHPT